MYAATGRSRRRLLGSLAGIAVILLGCGDQAPTGNDVDDGGLKIRIVSGEAQSAVAGTELPQPLVVQALTTGGNPIPGQIVNFRVVEGGGSVFAGAAITDGSGFAREWWTLGPVPGRNRIEARAVHPTTGERLVFAEFTATGLTTVPVASVTVTPATGAIDTGSTIRLTATPRDANGNALALPVAWSSSSNAIATVNDSGVVRGVAAGVSTITASSGGRSASATITVSAPVTQPPAPGTSIFSEGFESGSFAVWEDSDKESQHRIVTDAARARSGSRFLEVIYPQGGEAGWLTKFFMPGHDAVRMSYYVQFPTNWRGGGYLFGLYGSQVTNQWSGYGKAGQCPTGTDFTNHFMYVDYNGNPGNLSFYSYTMDMNRTDCFGDAGAGRAQYFGSRLMSRGAWHKVDLEVKLNTPGQADGWQRMYIDGVLSGEWSGMRQRSTTNLKINSLQLSFNVAGGAPQNQSMFIDDIVVSTLGAVEPPPPPPTSAPVASVTISPAAASITTDDLRQLSATLRDANGNVLTGRSITWSSDANTIATVSQGGLVDGHRLGIARITATSEGRSATSIITVTGISVPVPAPVATITLSPATLSLAAGTTQLITPTLRDALGNVLTGRTISWSSNANTVATVGQNGLVGANGPGTATITAASEGRTASVTVTVTSSTPPPSTGLFSNEPTGMTRVTDYSFDALNSGGWRYSTWDTFARIVQDPTAPGDPSTLEFVYPAGYTGGGAPARVAAPNLGSGRRELYWAFTWKANSGWQNHPSGVNKIGFGWQNGSSTFGLTWYHNVFGVSASPTISLFDGGIRYYHPNTAQAAPVLAGQWYEIEVYYKPSSASGRADGTVKIWINGVLMTNHVNVVTTPGTLNDVYFEPTWGGVGSTKSSTDWFRIGQARISVR